MSHGVIQGFSEAVEWKISDISSFDKVQGEYIGSPVFSLAGCTWMMRVYPKGERTAGYVSATLLLNDPHTDVKIAKFSIGIKTKNGIVEERTSSCKRAFKNGNFWGWEDFLDLNELDERKSELAPSDAVTFTCRLHRETPTPEEVEPNTDDVDSCVATLVELENLSSDLKDLLIGERMCDFTINVRDKEFRVHRSVLSARSPVFRAMLEHDTAEAQTGVLNVPDCHLESFQEFLGFLYVGKIKNVSFESAYHLYSTADKYDVQRLKSFCADCMAQNLNIENVCDVAILADSHCDDQLMCSAQNCFNESFLKIFLTSKWSSMLKAIPRLADKLLRKLSETGLKNP